MSSSQATQNTTFQFGPSEVCRLLPQNLDIQPITTTTLLAFRRLLALLLPIPYKDQFFSEIINNSVVANLSRVALWRTNGVTGKERHEQPRDDNVVSSVSMKDAVCTSSQPGVVVGGISCRLEPVPYPPTADGPVVKQQLYIQTLAVLAPYRGHGIATYLLREAIMRAMASDQTVESVYAHVWEKNEDALEWYLGRGFVMDGEMVQGYYRKLRPAGAVLLRKKLP